MSKVPNQANSLTKGAESSQLHQEVCRIMLASLGAFHVKYTQGFDTTLSDFDDFWYIC